MLATAHRDWTPQSYTFLMCKGTDSMESHSAFAYLPTIWTLIYIYWIMNFTQRDTSDRHDNTKAELPHRHGLEESPLAVLSVGEIHPIISWFHDDTTQIGVCWFLAGCHSTWKPSPESEVGRESVSPRLCSVCCRKTLKLVPSRRNTRTDFTPLVVRSSPSLSFALLSDLLLLSPPLCRLLSYILPSSCCFWWFTWRWLLLTLSHTL